MEKLLVSWARASLLTAYESKLLHLAITLPTHQLHSAFIYYLSLNLSSYGRFQANLFEEAANEGLVGPAWGEAMNTTRLYDQLIKGHPNVSDKVKKCFIGIYSGLRAQMYPSGMSLRSI